MGVLIVKDPFSKSLIKDFRTLKKSISSITMASPLFRMATLVAKSPAFARNAPRQLSTTALRRAKVEKAPVEYAKPNPLVVGGFVLFVVYCTQPWNWYQTQGLK